MTNGSETNKKDVLVGDLQPFQLILSFDSKVAMKSVDTLEEALEKGLIPTEEDIIEGLRLGDHASQRVYRCYWETAIILARKLDPDYDDLNRPFASGEDVNRPKNQLYDMLARLRQGPPLSSEIVSRGIEALRKIYPKSEAEASV